MTRARAKLLQAKVNSLLSSCDFGLPLDGLLFHATTLCILSYEEHHHPKPPRKKDQEKTLLELCTPESPDLPPVQAGDPSPGQSDTPSGDGSGD